MTKEGGGRGDDQGDVGRSSEGGLLFNISSSVSVAGGDIDDKSIHSCDTEGYYTTFHDFDGFQEILTFFFVILYEF